MNEFLSKMRNNKGHNLIQEEAFTNAEISPQCGLQTFCVCSLFSHERRIGNTSLGNLTCLKVIFQFKIYIFSYKNIFKILICFKTGSIYERKS